MQPDTVLITGASSGIGLELAHEFARHGNNVILVARGAEALNKLAKTLVREYGIRAETMNVDLTQPKAVNDLHARLKREKIQVDILVNNAGFGGFGEFIDTEFRHERKMIELNIIALTELCKLFGRDMARHGYGKILNTASIAGFLPGPQMAVYYATKAYVLSFSLALAEELQSKCVTVTALCPGPTRTNFAKSAAATKSKLFSGHLTDARKIARAGYRGLKRGQRIVVPGIRAKLSVLMTRLSSRQLQARIINSASQNK